MGSGTNHICIKNTDFCFVAKPDKLNHTYINTGGAVIFPERSPAFLSDFFLVWENIFKITNGQMYCALNVINLAALPGTGYLQTEGMLKTKFCSLTRMGLVHESLIVQKYCCMHTKAFQFVIDKVVF